MAVKCSKIETARAKHAKLPPLYFAKYAHLRRSCRRELWHQRRERRREGHKSKI